MKCPKLPSEKNFAGRWHLFWCKECREHLSTLRTVERGTEDVRKQAAPLESRRAAVDAVRALMIESKPVILSELQSLPERKPRLSWAYAAGGALALSAACVLAVVFMHKPAIKPERVVKTTSQPAPTPRNWGNLVTPDLAQDSRAPSVVGKQPGDLPGPKTRPNPTLKGTRLVRSAPLDKWSNKSNKTYTAHNRTSQTTKPKVDDLEYLNGESGKLAAHWVSSPDQARHISEILGRPLPPMKDDFIAPPPVFIASTGTPAETLEMAKAAEELYQQEAKIVDARLIKNVALAEKASSMEEICATLKKQTGVDISASSKVRDEQATIFIKSRPVRDIMRMLCKVFGFVWERSGKEGSYRYVLQQEFKMQLAEENLRKADVDEALLRLAEQLKKKAATDDRLAKLIYLAYSSMSSSEMLRFYSGAPVKLLDSERSRDAIAQEVIKNHLSESQEAHRYSNEKLNHELENKGSQIRFAPEQNTTYDDLNYVKFELKIQEFGGAYLESIVSNKITDSGVYQGKPYSHQHRQDTSICYTDSDEYLTRVKTNNLVKQRALKNHPDLARKINVEPRPTVSVKEQQKRVDEYDRIIEESNAPGFYGKPPLPFAASADVWEAIHNESGIDVLVDSFSELFPLKNKEGSLFDVLCFYGDLLNQHWKYEEGCLLARSSTYHWDKIKQVPKRDLERWQQSKAKNGFLPLVQYLEMGSLNDFQIKSHSVGLSTIFHWDLPEWTAFPIFARFVSTECLVARILNKLPWPTVETILEMGISLGQVPEEVKPDLAKLFLLYRHEPNVDWSKAQLGAIYIPDASYVWYNSGRTPELEGLEWAAFSPHPETVLKTLIVGKTRDEVAKKLKQRYPKAAANGIKQMRAALILILKDSEGGIQAFGGLNLLSRATRSRSKETPKSNDP